MGKKQCDGYIISSETKAIIAEAKSQYRSKILAESGEHYSLEKPEEIIDRACMAYHSSMEGRQTYAQEVLQIKSKVPFPVIPSEGVYFLPTTSSRNEDCAWISYYQIKSYDGNKDFVHITFYDHTSLVIRTSINIFDLQYKRASQIIAEMHRSNIFKVK